MASGGSAAAVSRKTFVCPEAVHIISVLDECVSRIDVLSLLPCELARPERVSRELGAPAAELLTDHVRLCGEHRSLREQDARAVQDSLRDFLRHVKPHNLVGTVETALQGAGPVNEEDQKAMRELGAGLRELRGVVMEQLMTTPQEERERKRHGQELRQRQQRNAELLQKLEQEVTAATEHRDKTMSRKDGEIQRMKDSFHQMTRVWEEFVQQVQKKAEQQHQSDLKNSEMKQLRLQEEANQLRTQLDLLTTQHREIEATLRKTNSRLETDIGNWIQKYDEEMETKQAQLESLTRTYEDELAERAKLQEGFAVLQLEYSQIMEERRRERERREEEEREREAQSRAAVVIQALWRGWRVRKATKNKTKSRMDKGKPKKGK